VTEEEWGALVGRLEVKAFENPKAYGRRVILLGALGYLVIGGAVAILIGLALIGVWVVLTGHPLAIKLVWPLAALGYVLLRALSVRIEPPTGLPISQAEAPALYEMIDDIVERVQGPRIHHVLLDGDINAFVMQVPRRFGTFGWTNYMVLGVPYMQALDPDQFRAVVAHEVGHLSRTHGRTGTWIYRIQATWQQLMVALEERGSWLGGLFRRFFEWYAPYFSAYSFPLRRRHEYEADQAAAEAAGARPAGSALLQAVLADAYLQRKYWPQVFERVDHEPSPPERVFTGLGAALANLTNDAATPLLLRTHLDSPPAPYDTHPTIRQRVEHLGLDVDELTQGTVSNGHAKTPSAATTYLEASEPRVVAVLDQDWRQAVSAMWQEQHRQAEESKGRLAELDAKGTERLSREERIERALFVMRFRSEDEAIGLLRDLVEETDDAYLRYLIGRTLLSTGDERGLRELDRSMELDPQTVPNSAQSAVEFLAERGRLDEAETYHARAVEAVAELEAAAEERRRVTPEKPLAPHRLDPGALERLRKGLASIAALRRAYLVRKPMQHLDEARPAHILLVEMDDERQLQGGMLSGIEIECWIVYLDREMLDSLELDTIPNALVFER
jgi:Zn-dependent protease with chaperone function